jgi:hypothetical protein
MTVRIVRLVAASGFMLLGACQTTGPVYQTYYLPGRETGDATALVRAAETRCREQADVQARNEYDRSYRQGEVNVPQPTGSTTSGAPQGLALSPTESAALAATRLAAVQAQQSAKESWDAAMKACMAKAGFRQVSVCVAHCPP